MLCITSVEFQARVFTFSGSWHRNAQPSCSERPTEGLPQRTYVGDQVCNLCHNESVEGGTVVHKPHAKREPCSFYANRSDLERSERCARRKISKETTSQSGRGKCGFVSYRCDQPALQYKLAVTVSPFLSMRDHYFWSDPIPQVPTECLFYRYGVVETETKRLEAQKRYTTQRPVLCARLMRRNECFRNSL